MPFDPTTIAGLKVWYKADAEAYSNGDPVTTWHDQSGNGNNATNGSDVAPTFATGAINSLPALTFNGSTQALTFSSFVASAWSVFAVFQTNNTTFQFRDVIDVQKFSYFYRLTGAFWGIGRNGVSDECNYAVAAVGTTWHVHHGLVTDSGTLTTIFLDGTQKATLSSGTSGGTVKYGIGNPGSGAFHFDGTIAEVLVYDSSLGSTDYGNVVSMLGTKYAITVAGGSNALPPQSKIYSQALRQSLTW